MSFNLDPIATEPYAILDYQRQRFGRSYDYEKHSFGAGIYVNRHPLSARWAGLASLWMNMLFMVEWLAIRAYDEPPILFLEERGA